MAYEFKALGKPDRGPNKELETFPAPAHVTSVSFISDELTSFCPVTGQPDFYTIEMEYEPDALCVESKSLKLYLWSFREECHFAEALASQIAMDLQQVLQPHRVRVRLHQNVRGGLQLTAEAVIGDRE